MRVQTVTAILHCGRREALAENRMNGVNEGASAIGWGDPYKHEARNAQVAQCRILSAGQYA